MTLDGLEGNDFFVVVSARKKPEHLRIVLCVGKGPDGEGFQERFSSSNADRRGQMMNEAAGEMRG